MFTIFIFNCSNAIVGNGIIFFRDNVVIRFYAMRFVSYMSYGGNGPRPSTKGHVCDNDRPLGPSNSLYRRTGL